MTVRKIITLTIDKKLVFLVIAVSLIGIGLTVFLSFHYSKVILGERATYQLIGEAAKAGAKLVALPENFAIMGMHELDKIKVGEADGKGPIQDFLSQVAKKYGIWVIGGTIPIIGNDTSKVRAACLIIDDKGNPAKDNISAPAPEKTEEQLNIIRLKNRAELNKYISGMLVL